MSVITVFNALYCNEELIVPQLVKKTGYRLVEDAEIVDQACTLSGLSADRISRAFTAKTSLFNPFTHEKERSIAYLRLAVADILSQGNLVVHGFCAHFIPPPVTHVLRLCLVADMSYRLQQAGRLSSPEKDVLKVIHKNDEDKSAWTQQLLGNADPWDSALYDIVIPTDKIGAEESVHLIIRNLNTDVLVPTAASLAALDDFRLLATVQVALTREGHDVSVAVQSGAVTLTIEKNVLMLSRLEQELKEIVENIEGVKTVTTEVGKDFHQADIYRKLDFQAPSRVLLVDDEREFVQTLSERLLLRDLGSAIAYDGESALEMVREDEPEVMILDLKMPGIDGIEVLKQVKATQPEIEVIILTGHGNETDRETCMQLGAFAYLQKPVDIDILSETMKQANEKIMRRQQGELS
ncbi:response regulator [Desulfobulbus oligotrophicus]|uniref:Response regulator n=1 Tax=Desulfobulbus oligotrophicus TaxID=1909699 RepID=A0A7T6AQ14_9BACT|nr:response regulator [Desulfobulbus oligotrophicus]QQG65000.1 response regulator [Desulfobulbus oligotrophicus]